MCCAGRARQASRAQTASVAQTYRGHTCPPQGPHYCLKLRETNSSSDRRREGVLLSLHAAISGGSENSDISVWTFLWLEAIQMAHLTHWALCDVHVRHCMWEFLLSVIFVLRVSFRELFESSCLRVCVFAYVCLCVCVCEYLRDFVAYGVASLEDAKHLIHTMSRAQGGAIAFSLPWVFTFILQITFICITHRSQVASLPLSTIYSQKDINKQPYSEIKFANTLLAKRH